jgi:hypothetical protein
MTSLLDSYVTKGAMMIRSQLVVAFLLLMFDVACEAAEVRLGINYVSWRLDPQRIAECPVHPAAVFWDNGILPQYNDPNVRQIVRRQLSSMRQAGFTSIRTRLSFRHPVKDRFEGPFSSTDGTLAAQDRRKIQDFTSDIAAAGFEQLEVSFGFGRAENSPVCRRQQWGDCFEPKRTDENWRFIDGATEATLSAVGQTAVRFDLLNEGCPAPSMPAATLLNSKRYFQTIAGRFQNKFGKDWLVSCANSAGSVRLRVMLDDLKEVGLTPKYVEIHSYKTDRHELEDSLSAAETMAEQIGAQLIIGEMRYHSAEQTATIKDWLSRTPRSRLVDVMQWPLANPSTKCPMDTPPPYSPGALRDINAGHP